MAYLTELDVINDMLATLGESPLNAITDDHPMVAAGVRFLKVVSQREQVKGWWFNKEKLTLTPDVSGFLYVPADCIGIDPTRATLPYVLRGRRLYDPTKTSYVFTQSVEVNIIRNIPFEDMPPSAADYIGASAVLKFQTTYDADAQKTADLKVARKEAYVTFNTEHIRNTRANLLYRRSMQEKMAQIGYPARP